MTDMSTNPHIPDYLQDWITARKRHGLSHAHVQMARELGMNPRKLGKLDNHDLSVLRIPGPRPRPHQREMRVLPKYSTRAGH